MRTIAVFLLSAVLASFSCAAFAASPVVGVGGAAVPVKITESGIVPAEGMQSQAPNAGAVDKSVASGLYMSGQYTYLLQNGVASITLDYIYNDSFTVTTGTLRLSLWALTYQPDRGAGITGYKLATYTTLSPLAPRTFYFNITRSASYTSPPNGVYWLVLVLDQFNPSGCPSNSDGYCLEDDFVSFNQVTFGSVLPTYNYSDLWWNPNESGWGVVVQHHTSNVAFIAWYTYDGSGNPKWYVASNCPMIGDGCTGTLFETSGPPFGPTFNPGAVSVRNVGTISFSFSGQSTGTMSYNVRGSTGVKSISRQPF